MNLIINNLIEGVQSAPFLACSGLAGSIPAASTKRIYLYAFLCVPNWGGVRSGGFSRTGDSFHNLQGHIIPILCNAAKGVLRLFCFVGL